MLSVQQSLAECMVVLRLLRRRIRGKVDPKRYRERQGITKKKRPDGKLLWIHGSAIGETQSALSLIRLLLEQDKDLSIMITSRDEASAHFLKDSLPERAFHQFCPFDIPRWCKRFLDHWQPTVILWTEIIDLNLNFISQAHQRAIPMFLGNARLSEGYLKLWSDSKEKMENFPDFFQMILPQDEEQQKRFEKLGLNRFGPVGNLKFFSRPLENDPDLKEKIETHWIQGRPVWSAASTHAQEEALLLKVHKQLLKTYPDLLLFLAPRHPHRANKITVKAQLQGLKTACRSSLLNETSPTREPVQKNTKASVLIFDSFGEMGTFYRLSSLVVMGGSLAPPLLGHNPIEPAQLNNALILGPYMASFQFVCSLFKDQEACLFLDGNAIEESLERRLKELLDNPEMRKELQERAFKLVQQAPLLPAYAKVLHQALDTEHKKQINP